MLPELMGTKTHDTLLNERKVKSAVASSFFKGKTAAHVRYNGTTGLVNPHRSLKFALFIYCCLNITANSFLY